jgi:hypothetical protein
VPVTRRALLRRAAGAGAALLAVPVPPAAAGPLHGLRCFSLAVDSLRGTSTPIRAPRAFALAGASWVAPTHASIELRSRPSAGPWGAWASASTLGHDGDALIAARGIYGEPIWTGSAQWVQLRCAAPVRGLKLHFVEPESAPALSQTDAEAAGAMPLLAPLFDAGGGQPPIIARRAWAAGRGPASPPGYGAVSLAFIHHTDSPNGYSREQVPAMIRTIYGFHRYVRGWNDIGYNFLVDAFGRIWEGRAGGVDLPVTGAQAGGYNLESTGIAVLGTYAGLIPTAAAQDALTRLLSWKLSLHGVPALGKVIVEVDPSDALYTPFSPGQRVPLPRIAGHRDGCTTGCPGNALYGRLPSIRPAVARLSRDIRSLSIGLSGGRLSAASFLSLAGSELLPGAPLSVSGRLTSLSGAPVQAAPVLLQRIETDAAGGASPQVLASLTTAADGSWTSPVPTATNLLIRAVHPGPPAAVSPLVWAAAAPAVSLEFAPGSPPPTSAGVVYLAGTVTPGKPRVAIIAVPSNLSPGQSVTPATLGKAAARGRHHSHQPAQVRRTVEVFNDGFTCTLRLPHGSWRVWAQSLADSRNVAGISSPLLLTI